MVLAFIFFPLFFIFLFISLGKIVKLEKDVNKLNENIFYNFINLKGRGDISKIRINRKIIKFIDESYNSNPLSVHSAIKNFDLIKKGLGQKNIILGDMLELGKHSKKLHEKLATVINSSTIGDSIDSNILSMSLIALSIR